MTSTAHFDKLSTAPAEAPDTATPPKDVDPVAASILNRAYEAHGGQRFNQANYGFTFRDKRFEFINDGDTYLYSSRYEKEGKTYYDRIEEGVFHRIIDENPQQLTEKETNSGWESLNSVIYFATLPNKLRDDAVNLFPAGTATIKGQQYDVLMVNFDEEGGGVDHDDNFLYWINQDSDRIDYLAYDYKTNKGGVRFRAAYNPRVVGGLLFQDYVNYMAPIGTALIDLPALYEQDKLKELSVIATEEVVQLD